MMPPPTPRRRNGREFLLGFLPGLLLAIAAGVPIFTAELFTPIIIVGGGLVMAAVLAFIGRRPFIGVGIITVLVAAPLLLVGSCFAIFAYN